MTEQLQDEMTAPIAIAQHPAASLREPGGVLLISCYELGHQPINLASPAAWLRGAGFQPATLDTSVEEIDDAALRDARLVAISVPMHTALRLGVRIAEQVRRVNPAAHITFYGLYATLNQAWLLDGRADSAIGGEYEATLLQLASALDDGAPLGAIAGLSLPGRPADPVLARLPAIAPDRSSLPDLRDYAGLEIDGTIVRGGYLETTRGCHHTCAHCPLTPVYGGRFFAIDREQVIEDARRQVGAGARHFTFGDPDFFNGPQHGLRIMRALRAEFPRLTFDATIKIEHLLEHRRLVPELGDLGCLFVVSAVESLNPVALEHMRKGHTREMVDEAIDVLDEAGIAMRPSLLPFSPWETAESYLGLLRWIAESGMIEHIDPVHLSIRLLVPPGSAILDDPDFDRYRDALQPENFAWAWRHPDPRMDDLQQVVAKLAERGSLANAGEQVTFARIWDAAHDLLGRPGEAVPQARVRRDRPPRLTENWFC